MVQKKSAILDEEGAKQLIDGLDIGSHLSEKVIYQKKVF